HGSPMAAATARKVSSMQPDRAAVSRCSGLQNPGSPPNWTGGAEASSAPASLLLARGPSGPPRVVTRYWCGKVFIGQTPRQAKCLNSRTPSEGQDSDPGAQGS